MTTMKVRRPSRGALTIFPRVLPRPSLDHRQRVVRRRPVATATTLTRAVVPVVPVAAVEAKEAAVVTGDHRVVVRLLVVLVEGATPTAI